LIGFFSKQFVLYSAVQSGYYFMAIVAILVSVISASYYLKIIRVLHTNTEEIIQDETDTYYLNNDDRKNYISKFNLTNRVESEEYLDLVKPLINSKSENKEEEWSIMKDYGINHLSKIDDLNSESLLTNFHSFLISSLTLTILLFVLKPSIILNSTQLLSLSLFNF
jgi:NADH-ubiquinone oxidoreductase chain 2